MEWSTKLLHRLRADRGPAPDPVIDLRDGDAWWCSPQPAPDPRLVEALRRRAKRDAAFADLDARRRWHWSGDRIVQESPRDGHWWEQSFADPYAILDLVPGASWADVAAARRRIARDCHPDLHPGGSGADLDEKVRRMAAANDACERLRQALCD